MGEANGNGRLWQLARWALAALVGVLSLVAVAWAGAVWGQVDANRTEIARLDKEQAVVSTKLDAISEKLDEVRGLLVKGKP